MNQVKIWFKFVIFLIITLPFTVVPDPVVEEIECNVDADCASKEACINEECTNPCRKFQPCVANADCKVYDTLPLRTMTCSCIEGYTGKGDELCVKIGK